MASGPVETRVVYEFGPFRVDPAESRLLRDGLPVPLTPKAFETLVALVSRAGRLVDKAELMREVWPDAVVEESSLSQHVYLVRKALGDERGDPHCIETVPKRGYRFVAPVQARSQPPDEGIDTETARVPRGAPAAVHPAPAEPPGAVPVGAAAPASRARLTAATVVAVGLTLVTAGALRPGRAPARADVVSPAQGGDTRGAPRVRVPTRPEAYDAYVRGLYFWNQRTAEGLRRAARAFEDAVARDPDFAPAHAGLADAIALSAVLRYGALPPEQAFERARAAAQRALQLDDTLATAHTALALVLTHADADRRAAEREYRLALKLDPGSATALQRYARLLIEENRLAPAVQVTERALALDPLSPALSANLCYLLYLQRDYERALRYCDKAIELQPGLVQAHTSRALIEAQQGRPGAALAQLEVARAGAEGKALIELLDVQGYAYARAGRPEAARANLAKLRGLTSGDDAERLSMLGIHAALGDTDNAFALLRSCADHWRTQPFELVFDPRYDSLRHDPRYGEVVSRTPPAGQPAEGLAGGAGDHQTLSTLF